MGLEIELDDETLAVLTAVAEERLSSLEATVVSILREALQPAELELRNAVQLLPRASAERTVSLEMVREIDEELLREEHQRFDALPRRPEPPRRASR